jgi:hypothetical protein
LGGWGLEELQNIFGPWKLLGYSEQEYAETSNSQCDNYKH